MAKQGYRPKVGSLPADRPTPARQTLPSACSPKPAHRPAMTLLSGHLGYSLFLFSCIPLSPDQQGALTQGLFQSLVGPQTLK